jgi:hypothetical protein
MRLCKRCKLIPLEKLAKKYCENCKYIKKWCAVCGMAFNTKDNAIRTCGLDCGHIEAGRTGKNTAKKNKNIA